jgi:hypothetical protein
MPEKFLKIASTFSIASGETCGMAFVLLSKTALYCVPDKLMKAAIAVGGLIGMAKDVGNQKKRRANPLYFEPEEVSFVDDSKWPVGAKSPGYWIRRSDVEGWSFAKSLGAWQLVIKAKGEEIRIPIGIREKNKERITATLKQYGWQAVRKGARRGNHEYDDDYSEAEYSDDESEYADDEWEETERQRQRRPSSGNRRRKSRSGHTDREAARDKRQRKRLLLNWVLPIGFGITAAIIGIIVSGNRAPPRPVPPPPLDRQQAAAAGNTVPEHNAVATPQ